ncbi:MAG: ASPIC/UnbV domain-containing protein, partial [Bryobacteraceae bacterium]
DVTAASGAPLRKLQAARGAAFGDLNNDGFVDIVINCNNAPPLVLENSADNGNHWLLVNTIGTVSNRDGIGARIRIILPDGRRQYAIVSTASSYLSSSDKRVHFGLGSERSVTLLEITWPSGIVQRLKNVPADRLLTVREPSSSPAP